MNKPDLSSYKRTVFFTGAGMSAESGVATYRGKGGGATSTTSRRPVKR
ncbi:MAG: hypothetical protein ACP5R6_06030 [Chlorobaculum sp.]